VADLHPRSKKSTLLGQGCGRSGRAILPASVTKAFVRPERYELLLPTQAHVRSRDPGASSPRRLPCSQGRLPHNLYTDLADCTHTAEHPDRFPGDRAYPSLSRHGTTLKCTEGLGLTRNQYCTSLLIIRLTKRCNIYICRNNKNKSPDKPTV
jgi:hypothetical protein